MIFNGVRTTGNSRFIECDTPETAALVMERWAQRPWNPWKKTTSPWECLACHNTVMDASATVCNACGVPRQTNKEAWSDGSQLISDRPLAYLSLCLHEGSDGEVYCALHMMAHPWFAVLATSEQPIDQMDDEECLEEIRMLRATAAFYMERLSLPCYLDITDNDLEDWSFPYEVVSQMLRPLDGDERKLIDLQGEDE